MDLLAGRFGSYIGYIIDLVVENRLVGAAVYFLLSRVVMDPLHRAVAYAVSQRAPYQVLDIGTGDGRFPLLLISHASNARIVALDSNPSMVHFASRRIGGERRISVDLVLASVKQLHFPDDFFDQILIVASFHHLIRHRLARVALNEIFRVLALTGEAWIVEFDNESSRQETAAYASLCRGWRKHLAYFAIRLHGLGSGDVRQILGTAKSIGLKTDFLRIQHATVCVRMKKL